MHTYGAGGVSFWCACSQKTAKTPEKAPEFLAQHLQNHY